MDILRHLARKLHGPRCHVSPEEKAWVERRMIWLKGEFGSEPIRRTALDPTSELLPRKWDASYAAGADLFKRLSGFMLLDHAAVPLHFYSKSESHEMDSPSAGSWQSSGPAGLYFHGKGQANATRAIALEESGLQTPALLAATICHELAHVHLDGRLKPDEQDAEPLADLLTVYFGAGILTANSVFQFNQWQEGTRYGWHASRHGYLSEQVFAYALACFSWYRGDLKARWRAHLRKNVEFYFSDAMHFLASTSDTTIPFDGA